MATYAVSRPDCIHKHLIYHSVHCKLLSSKEIDAWFYEMILVAEANVHKGILIYSN